MSKNESKNSTFNLRHNEKRLYNIIIDLVIAGKKFRAYGSGHSCLDHSPMFDSSCFVQMGQYLEEPYLEDNQGNKILVVSPGLTLNKIRNYLAKHNLRLYGTPESETITIGGAILFAAHNGSAYWDSLANYVVDMVIVDGNGLLKLIDDPQLFINYGLLGIVLRIRIRVFQAENHEWKHTLYSSTNFKQIEITKQTYCLFFAAYSSRILRAEFFFTKKRPKRNFKRFIWDLALWSLTYKLVAKLIPVITYIMPWIGIFSSKIFTYQPDVIRDKFDYFEPVPKSHTFTLEYAIELAKLEEAYNKIMPIISKFRKKGTYVMRFWSRFQKSTEKITDLPYKLDSALVEVTINDMQKYSRQMVYEISQVLLQLGGRPHLAKSILSTKSLQHYDFAYLKKAIDLYDPNHLFFNKFSQNIFK